jgi:phosphate/sulfate permease
MKLAKLISINILAIAVAAAFFVGLPTGAHAMTPTLAVATTDNDNGGDNDEGNHKVPDAGSTALLLGSALGGLAVLRRFVKR